MTTCIADVCGNGRAIALAADKALGLGHVESSSGEKIIHLHPNWRVLYAGRDTAPALPIVEKAAAILKDTKPTTLEVAVAMTKAWKEVRDERSEAKILKGRPGWTLERFYEEGKDHFPQQDYARLTDAIESQELDLELLIAGFDDQGRAALMSMEGAEPSIPERRTGYWAIGSGAPNAMTFLTWRRASTTTPVRAALAHVVEAKYYGELAPGNSEETDVILMQADKADIRINEKDVEDVLFQKIAIQNRPRNMTFSQLALLNNLKDLEGLPYVSSDEKRNLIEVAYDADQKPEAPRKVTEPSPNPVGYTVSFSSGSVSTATATNPKSPPRPKRGRKDPPASAE